MTQKKGKNPYFSMICLFKNYVYYNTLLLKKLQPLDYPAFSSVRIENNFDRIPD
jgi:hypothetical protein